jgi:broad specificity phosphatase PhoE
MNAQRRVQGWIDSPLDALGRSQAEAVACRLRSEDPEALYTSTLRRARETAEIIVAAFDDLPLVGDDRLRERKVGDIAGMNSQEIEAQFPGLLKRWRESCMVCPPGAEPREGFWQRVVAVFDDIATRHPDGTVVVVTHGGVLATYMGHLLGLKEGRWPPISFGNTSLSIVVLNGGQPDIQLVNDRCHLKVEVSP